MSAFRELLNAFRDQARAAPPQPPGRPTSLYEAGSVGGARQRVTPASAPHDATQGELSPHRNLYPESPMTPAEAPRRPPRAAVAAPRRPDSRTALRAALRSPASLRTAILLREVLDPPVSLREDRR